MKVINNFIYIIISIFILGCSSSRNKVPDFKPTVISYPKNDMNLLYYSKYEYSYNDVLNNLKNVIVAPHSTIEKLVYKIPPEFPLELVDDKDLNRTVIVKMHVDQKGLIEAIIIEKSGGDYLDNNCIDAVKQWIFKPFQDKPFCITIPFNFRSQ
jgi:TonB family protein